MDAVKIINEQYRTWNNTGLDLSFLNQHQYTITDRRVNFYVDEETGEHRVNTEVHWLEDGVPGMIHDDRLLGDHTNMIFPTGIRIHEADLSSVLLPASNTMTHNREYYNYLGDRVDAEVYPRANETAQATTRIPTFEEVFHQTPAVNRPGETVAVASNWGSRLGPLPAGEQNTPYPPENAEEWYGDLENGPYWIFNYRRNRTVNRVHSSMYLAGPNAVEFSPWTTTFTPIEITRDGMMYARYNSSNNGIALGRYDAEPAVTSRFMDLEIELRMVLGRYTGAPNSSETRERIRLEIAHVLEKHGVGRTSIDVHGTAVVGEIEVTITPEAGESAWGQRQSPYFWKEEAEKREIEEEMAKLEKIEINEDVF